MKSAITAFCLAACAFSSLAFAAPPAAPVVTVGASNIKQLQFDWPSVPGVATYELWFRAAPGAQWVKYADTVAQRPLIRINISVHLLDWRVARYRVAACNPSGCTNSAEVGVQNLALDTVGYLKPIYSSQDSHFGGTVAMSADGKTAAVATGELDSSNASNGTVYVYRKPSSSAAWRLEARLIPSLYRRYSGSTGGTNLAVNGDGTLIAYGRSSEGIGGRSENGAVYLFRRTGSVWKQEKRLQSGPPFDRYGYAVDLDDSGNTLAIWHEANSSIGFGVTEIFNHTGAGWQPVATLPLPAPPPGTFTTCYAIALSGDGQRLVRTCSIGGSRRALVHNAPDWEESANIVAGDNTQIDTNADGTLFVVRQNLGVAHVYRLQQGVWALDSGNPLLSGDPFRDSGSASIGVSMSRDGKIIALGHAWDTRGEPGPNYPPIDDAGGGGYGSVYVFERKPAGWTLRRLMRPSVDRSSNFGQGVALGADGKNMIVGAWEDSSGARLINGDMTDMSAPGTGAAWLY